MCIVHSVASMSKDRRTKVGAIAIGPAGEPRSWGYNGQPRGCDDNIEARHARPEKYLWTEHAERNLIYNAARVGTPLEGSTLLVSPLFPCMDCARAIVQAGFVEVFAEAEDNPRWRVHAEKARELFTECGIVYTEI